MYTTTVPFEARRTAPRTNVEAFCSEILDGRERHAVVLDLSHTGLRVARPFTGGRTPSEIQLEIELPGVDEIIWAKGQVCYDRVRPPTVKDGTMALGKLVRTSGIRLVSAAARDLRVLREYVLALRRERDSDEAVLRGLASPWFALA
jgi:hypothetical protein